PGALLGIGAYGSPEMMTAEYAVRGALTVMAYSWTSRAPTSAAAIGVDLFAPCGASAPVPKSSLQPSRAMNGTSMASPNACGSIALLLSGMKAQEQQYTPALIRRALQNAAEQLPEVDPFAQGAGLVRVDRAWGWLTDPDSTP